jgi:hypothetical protein
LSLDAQMVLQALSGQARNFRQLIWSDIVKPTSMC